MVVVVLVMRRRRRRRRGLDSWEAFEIEEAAELEVLPKDVVVVVGHGRGRES